MLSNQDVVRTLERIAGLLEIRGGDNTFKARAYRQAAVQVENLSGELSEIAATGGLRDISGFGPSVAGKVEELVTTGHLGYLEDLEAEIPPTLLAVCEIPGVGPRTAAMLWRDAGITTLDELDAAARSGSLGGLPRMGPRSVEKIVAAVEAHRRAGRRRRPREQVAPLVEALTTTLRDIDDVERVEVAGSYRRGRATVGDLDVLTATTQPVVVLTAFAALPQVERVLLRGDTKCSVEAGDGLQVDCRAVTPEQFGAAWQYFTGSQAHNIRLRGLALRQGLTLNEYGVFRIDGGERVAGATEEDVYACLGLRWIAPEQREDRGEIDAARIEPAAELRGSTRQETRA